MSHIIRFNFPRLWNSEYPLVVTPVRQTALCLVRFIQTSFACKKKQESLAE